MTEPLTTPETDVRDLDGFMLNAERLMASELWALSTPEEFKAAVALWCRAWKQVPAGSLPNDDKVLAAFAGAGARWQKIKEMALRGFVLCSDGRLYNRTLCEDATRAYKRKLERRERTKAASAARHKERNGERNDLRNGERNAEHKPSVTTSQGQDRTGTGQDAKKDNSSLRSLSDLRNDFDVFWQEYPHKVGKPAAFRAFGKALKFGSLAEILEGLARYRRDKPSDRPWLNPATFLNQQRWGDEPASILSLQGERPNLLEISRQVAQRRAAQ